MKKLLEEVKKELEPDKRIISEVKEVVNKINKTLKASGIKAVCVTGGSIAKGTFLRDDYDVDLFVRFDYSYKKKDLSNILEKILKKDFKPVRVHGSRDYFQIKKTYLFEIIPVLKINNYKKAVNVTDMSPLHAIYVSKKLRKGQDNDIRLAKQFCKATKVYGAESYIKGFSGHIVDLLIIHYGSFTKLLRAASKWKEKVIIDIEKHLKNPVKELDKAKTYSPMIIVDPVQPDRNAAAALSKEKFDLFITTCKKFLKHPSREFFRVKNIDKAELKKKSGKNDLTFIEAEALKGKKDVVGAKLMKVYEYLHTSITRNDFRILDADWEFDKKGFFYFIIKKETLSEKVILKGPPMSKKEGVKRFRSAHKKTFEKKKRLYAEEKRKHRTIIPLVKELLKEKYIKERVKKIVIS